MFEASQLLGFLAAVVVLVLVPGPNTMLILAHSLGGGRAVGLATVAGVELGTVVHTIAAALGVSALLSTSAAAFNAVKYAGAVYLIVLGVRALRHTAPQVAGSTAPVGAIQAFRRAVLTNVLNPKVALFFLAFLPQFVRPERGQLLLQFVVLGLIVSAVGLCFGSALALAAGSLSAWLHRHAAFGRWQHRFTGAVLLGLGVHLALAPAR